MPSLSYVARRVELQARSSAVLYRSGILKPDLPHRQVAMVKGIARYGAFGGIVTATAVRFGDRVALHDDLGALTWADVERRTNAVANALIERGVKAGDGVA